MLALIFSYSITTMMIKMAFWCFNLPMTWRFAFGITLIFGVINLWFGKPMTKGVNRENEKRDY